ncbi:hypothetical protein F751_0526 [Auxenochlorella protothecoides]|uniref:Uncharacterized protein n=1 Tax=Auxenochlorella protothecoides TaxID=3075 RepID=A0A087SIE5_AUXPR|nr:hypothetical protein F751_0526 [Auxenochlorella protothecoides]KFM25499.1 hypothetical protein F751_0526 [Auxenochlorella protothecoides]
MVRPAFSSSRLQVARKSGPPKSSEEPVGRWKVVWVAMRTTMLIRLHARESCPGCWGAGLT